MAGSVPRAAASLCESLNGRPRHRENQVRGLAPKGSLFPPVKRPRCGKAKCLAQDHPPHKWQDRIYGHRQLGHPRHGASPFPLGAALCPQAREVQGLPLAAKPPSLTLHAGPGGTQHPSSAPARGIPPASLPPAPGSLPGNPTLKNSRPCILLDRPLFLWDRLCTSL